MEESNFISSYNDPILITGSNGFIGHKVVETLLSYGFKNLRCFVRSSKNISSLKQVIAPFDKARVEIFEGNLLSAEDCKKATKHVRVLFHLAAGTEKSFAGCYMNSVVTTKNLLESILRNKTFKRFVNVSSITVYSNKNLNRNKLLDEECEIDSNIIGRGEAYSWGKIMQDQMVIDYNKKFNIPYVIVRPGVVYGPGKKRILGLVGIDTFGFFIHIGGSNIFPLTYIENCAEAIVLAGIKKGIEGEVFNIVDDELPTCRSFLKMYKKSVGNFFSIYMPYCFFYFFCYLWEKYSKWSNGQIPPVFNRHVCAIGYKGTRYTNQKLKNLLDWKPKVSFNQASKKYFDYVKNGDN
ncbi:MAG: NAD(P)-dependent oxidoreductase [Deltaproteobacteria bacterium]|jgi:nucleoside-diphosphate-sugar epimerase|nr:NAD(P)-dependent oxidoreductase [Deltaproteobacteria bacterium]